MASLDTNGDGVVSDDERKAGRAKRAEELHARADTDHDGKLTPQELANSAFRRFRPEDIDTDHNGEISVAELAAAFDHQAKLWGADRLGSRLRRGN